MTMNMFRFTQAQSAVLSSFMTHHRVCNKSNTNGVISGVGTAYPSGPEYTPGFSGVGTTYPSGPEFTPGF